MSARCPRPTPRSTLCSAKAERLPPKTWLWPLHAQGPQAASNSCGPRVSGGVSGDRCQYLVAHSGGPKRTRRPDDGATTMRKWLPLLTVCLGTFMLLIDVTIVNVALPKMVSELHASFGSLQWVVDAYALTLAALVLGTGSIADLIGHRQAYIGGLALFAISSFVCGVSPNSDVLVGARAVQGVGAAAMFATTFALLNSNYGGRDRGTAYGMWGAVAGASAAVGPIIGGFLTEAISWRWIFFVNLPVSVLAIALCVRALKDANEPRQSRIDVWGMLTFSGAAGAATFALIRANEDGWSNALTWLMLTLAAGLLIVFVAVERRIPHAMLDLALLRRRSFVGVLIGGILLTFAAFAAFTYTSIWLQSVLGMSPIQSGLVGLPMSVMAFTVSAAIGRFLHGDNLGPIIGIGLLFIGAGGLLGALLTHGTATWTALVPGFLVIGVGVGLATPTLGSAAMSAVPPQRGGMAAGAVNTARQLGFAFGIAALGSVFTARAQGVLSDHGVPSAAAAARAVAGGQSSILLSQAPPNLRAATDSAVHASAVSGLQSTLAVAGAVGILAGLLVLVLVRPSGVAGPVRQGEMSAVGPQEPGKARRAFRGRAEHSRRPLQRAAQQVAYTSDEATFAVTRA
jgi:EmrB/QacA subfamily drug resistance transporter